MADGEAGLQLNQQLIVDTRLKVLFKPKWIVFNFIFSIVIALLIIHAGNVNILSSYNGTVIGDNNSYFHCGWNTFATKYCDDYTNNRHHYSYSQYSSECNSYTTESNSWRYKLNKQLNYDYYDYPENTGEAWFYCNIISLILLFISEFGHIKIYHYISKSDNNINITKLKKIYIITILFQSCMPTIQLVFGIIYWFQSNTNYHGCWNNQFTFYDDNGVSVVFNERRFGESMICGKRKKQKNNEQILIELNAVDQEGVIPDQYAQMIHIQPAYNLMNNNDQNSENEHLYLSIKTWFNESVAIQNTKDNNFKEIYYNLLIENGFDNFGIIQNMNMDDLKTIGVDKLGHQKTIFEAIKQLKEEKSNMEGTSAAYVVQ
eukprot:486528_1